jgi:nucleoside-diphosphate-sugar epimerase
VRARFQNVYGPGEILGAGHWRGTVNTVWRNVTPTFVYRSLKRLPLVVDGGGEASRDFVYVGDVVDAFVAAGGSDAEGACNVSTGTETTVLELASALGIEVDHAAERPGEVRRSCLDPAAAARMLGWTARVPLADGLERTLAAAR